MANNKNFILKNAIEIGGGTKVTLGDAPASVSATVKYALSDASYDSVSFSLAAQETSPHGITFDTSGTRFYISGIGTDIIYQYNLNIAWDLSTSSYSNKNFSVASQEIAPRQIAFKEDGLKMYMVGNANDSVYQYSLSTAWDISTASYDSISFSVASQEINPSGISFKPDGTKMYIVGWGNNRAYQYSLSTAWDLSTASYDSVFLDLSNQDTFHLGGIMSNSGNSFFVVGNDSNSIFEYTLSTAYDLSTAQDTTPTSVAFKSDGTKMYVVGTTSDTVYQYTTASLLSTATFDTSTGNYFTHTPSVNSEYVFSDAGDVQSFQLEVTPSATITITWPTSIEWSGGTAPDSPAANEKDLYTITTDDGGITYFGVQSGDAFG